MELDSDIIKQLMYYKDEYQRLQRFIVYTTFRLMKRDWNVIPDLEYDNFNENPYLWALSDELKKILNELNKMNFIKNGDKVKLKD
jgi:hypothetical protein